MKINKKLPENFERMTDQRLNMLIDKNCTDYSDKMKSAMKSAMAAVLNTDENEMEIKGENDDQIELALSNIRAAMTMLNEGDIKSELRSAEHHLTREQPIKKVSQLKYKDGKLWEIRQQRSK